MIDRMCSNELIIWRQLRQHYSTLIIPFAASLFAIANRIFVSTNGMVYLSQNDGRCFHAMLQTSDDDSTVWHNQGIDETQEGLIIIGEYANIIETGRAWNFWKPVAYLYVSHNDGDSWYRCDYLVRTGAKHVH